VALTVRVNFVYTVRETVGDETGWATIGDPGKVLSASFLVCFFKVGSSKDESFNDGEKRVDDVLTSLVSVCRSRDCT